MKYTCYDNLKNNILKYRDCVQFKIPETNKILNYTVHEQFLASDKGLNTEIFDLLGIDNYEIAGKCYGYTSYIGSWPEYKINDYKAATKLVLKLYEIIEKNTSIKNQDIKNSILIPAKKYKQTNKIPENTEIILTI